MNTVEGSGRRNKMRMPAYKDGKEYALCEKQ